jgi:hypothetical protein
MKRFLIAIAVLSVVAPVMPLFGGLERRASAAPGDAPAVYRLTPGEDVVYEISVKMEITATTKTTMGYLLLHPKSVDPASGQTTFGYSWAVKNVTTVENDQPTTQENGLPGDFFSRADTAPEVVVDSRGAIISDNSPADSPTLDGAQGPPWCLPFQSLPPAGQGAWATQRQMMLYRTHTESTPAPGRPGFPPGFGGFGRPGFGQQQNTTITRVETPADETIQYSTKATRGNLMTVARKYHMATLEKIGDVPIDDYVGLGEYAFDVKKGMLDHLDWDIVGTFNAKNIVVRTPISVESHRLTADDIAKLKASAAASATAAAAGVQERQARINTLRARRDAREALVLPSDEVQAAQLKTAEAAWHNKGAATDVLANMVGTFTPPANGKPTAVGRGQRIRTAATYKTPVTFQFIVFSGPTDLRFGYAFDQIIFNWEMRGDELRVDGGPDHGLHPKPGVGSLPANQWVGVEFTVTATEAILYLNGKEIDRLAGDFSNINQPFFIEGHGGPVDIKSIKVIAN